MTSVAVSNVTIETAAAAFRAGTYSPVELVEAYLARIEELDPILNSYITITTSAARAAAEVATRELRDGVDRGSLHGIPIAYKDLFATAGTRTTAGSRIHADRVPAYNATVVTRLAQAGAISLGKLNTHEFAFGVVHPDYGPVRNPWNIEHATGGSSSGAGAALASGLCLAALGSDTGGSIRLPAAWCGVVGMKPTFGLVSRHGVDPLSPSLDHAGPMTRTVRDAALVLEAIAGHDSRDPGSAPQAGFCAAALDSVDLAGLRVGVPWHLIRETVTEEIQACFCGAVERLSGLGMAVETVEIKGIDKLLLARKTITFAEAATYHARWLRQRRGQYSKDLLSRLDEGARVSALQYLQAQRTRFVAKRAARWLHRQVDLMATPSVPMLADPLQEIPRGRNGGPVDFHARIRFLEPSNVTGAPAISVPCGLSRSGLPIGLQLSGRPFEDHVVLAAAAGFEAVCPKVLFPPLAASVDRGM